MGLLPTPIGTLDDPSRMPDTNALAPLTADTEALKTPTSAGEKDGSRSPRSPRRRKTNLARDRDAKATSVVMSEEEGARADDEDGYGDLLSAYSEDEPGGSRRSIVA